MDIGDIEYFIEESKDMDEVLDIYLSLIHI